MCFARTSP
jgi:sodium/potassium-transporting ATPase subunit alpha